MVPIKIALVAPGIMEIPPTRWGAVEMMLWDYYVILSKHNNVIIINTPNKDEIIKQVNEGNFDVVHVHYDVFVEIMPKIKARLKILSSHYPYINNPFHWHQDGYNKLVYSITDTQDFHLFVSSKNDKSTFTKLGADPNKVFISKLGIRKEDYSFNELPTYYRTLCFSQIVDRKRQFEIQNIYSIDFYGRLDDSRFFSENYKGEADRKFLNAEITKYSNFILLSSVENTTPLVVKEALIAGLGVVVSEQVAEELDSSKDFISIIPESKISSKISDIEYIRDVLKHNMQISVGKRTEIRKYALDNFDLESILYSSYLKRIHELL